MSPAACQYAVEGVGSGVAASLQGVDCAASQMAQMAFARLFGSEGALVPALTILLTLYVALFAFALITGRSRLGISNLTPRIATLGLVLTFATRWIAYQSVVWNLVTGAPNQLAGLLTGTAGNATQVFAEKIDVVFVTLMQSTNEQAMQNASAFTPPGLLWFGATLLLLGTVGVLATTRIALAVLLALGPVFVVLALFQGTRGLFVGWIKAVVLLALTPLFAVVGGSLMLDLAVPVLSALTSAPDQIDPRAAMAFFMIGAVHCALMALTLKIATTMVSGWTVFGLANKTAKDSAPAAPEPRAATVISGSAAGVAVDQARQGSVAPARAIRMSDSARAAANDSGPSVRGRDTRVVESPGAAARPAAQFQSRAKGVGSKFRSAPARRTESLK